MVNNMEPITPEKVISRKRSEIPAGVIEVFNDLIVDRWDGKKSIIFQDEVVEKIMKKMHCDREEVFDEGYLNIEELYKSHGWHVVYSRPLSSECHFVFTQKEGK